MAQVKLGRFSLSFVYAMVLFGLTAGFVKTKRDSQVGYLYDAPQQGFGISSLKETQEIKDEIQKEIKKNIEEEIEEEIEKGIEEAKEEVKEEVKEIEDKLLHHHGGEYIPPRNHGHEHGHKVTHHHEHH